MTTPAITAASTVERTAASRPRLGFLGTGWIGRNRMEAIGKSGLAEVAAIVDPSPDMANAAKSAAGEAAVLTSYDEMLEFELDGIVIGTPSAQHATQAVAALEKGLSVFCQKPLARTAEEARRVVDAARTADRLLSVDFSYRFISGMSQIRDDVKSGHFGKIFAANLVFHNAYGPDKAWFYDPEMSGGGCVMDLGVHLIDLCMWTLDSPAVDEVSSQLISGGTPIVYPANYVEDFAVAEMRHSDGTVVQMACSWNLHAGCDAVIEASFYGTNGGASLRNVNGSFFDFTVERYKGTSREVLSQAGTHRRWEWGGLAAVDWTRRLSRGELFDPECENLVTVSEIIDRIYRGE